MKAVRALAVADASALPGLRRALSPESIELVGVASTPRSVLAQLRRVYPDVVVVDLSLSQTDVLQLIAQVVQEHTVAVLALASGEESASLAERARAAGANDVVERRTVAGSWHEESGSPHVLSLRVLSLAASARPRPSKLSLQVSRQPLGASPIPPLSAADAFGRSADARSDASREVRPSPHPASEALGRPSEEPAGVPRAPRPTPLSAAGSPVRPSEEPAGVPRATRTSPLSAAGSPVRPSEEPAGVPRADRVSSLSAELSGRTSGATATVSRAVRESQLSAAELSGRTSGETGGVSSAARGSPLSAAELSGRSPGSPSPLAAPTSARVSSLAQGSSAAEPAPTGAPQSTGGASRSAATGVLPARAPGSALVARAHGAEASPPAAHEPGSSRALGPKTGRPLMAAQVELVAIGASTGGTLALAELLKTLPESAPPMLVVQHMLPEFTNDFAQRLDEVCEVEVRVAVDGEVVKPGTVLLAPGGRHLRVMRDTEQRLRARVTDELPVGKHRPSVDVLFQACAETLGSAALGVLLTGMGDDGARGLLALHNNGARTLVQDQASSVCFGMPSAAIALGAAQQVLSLQDIAQALRELVKSRDSARV